MGSFLHYNKEHNGIPKGAQKKENMNDQENLQQDNQEDLVKLRHSAAHLLAAAVLELYPEAKPTIGPSTDEGFYYDFDFGDTQISEKDLPAIEKKMRFLVKGWGGFERQEVSKQEALERYRNNEYKAELIEEISGLENQDGESEVLTLYKSGEFTDLCRGGHVEKPAAKIKHFKLLSVAGAYWRGSEENKMLTRIYGTAFFSAEELDAFIKMKKEAKERDHKKLGRELDLFTFSSLVGSGLPLWTPRGTLMRNILDDFVWELRKARGYERVEIPHITKKDLYEVSGHWAKFGEELFSIKTREGHHFVMKPMNCPHHTQIFDRKPHSYKDMPQRYANTTMVYRDEQSGELSGLSRVRSITQDDAHVFCRESQIKEEILKIWDIIDEFYSAVGFELSLRLSLSDPEKPENYMGGKDYWNMAENALREIAVERGAETTEAVGEAAFYGPKLDFMAKDSLGREWQVATNQLDMSMPESFGLVCTNEKGEKEPVVMIHAAIMGSIERYMSILIEHFAGKFPVWLAPVQVKILPISDKYMEYAQKVEAQLVKAGVRTELDDRAERLQAKIRDAQMEKVPYMLVVGEKEMGGGTVAVRQRDTREQEVVKVEDFVNKVVEESDKKKL
jgi:threonyl-tRNA synthetase